MNDRPLGLQPLSTATVILSAESKGENSVRHATSPQAARPALWGAGAGRPGVQAGLGGPDSPRWSPTPLPCRWEAIFESTPQEEEARNEFKGLTQVPRGPFLFASSFPQGAVWPLPGAHWSLPELPEVGIVEARRSLSGPHEMGEETAFLTAISAACLHRAPPPPLPPPSWGDPTQASAPPSLRLPTYQMP